VNNPLDYDIDNSCEHFLGIAQDRDGWNSTCQIEICLQPINEYSPEIQLESRVIYINIDNTSVIELNAFDQDVSPSSFLSFQFEQTSKCNLTCLSNGTIYINQYNYCLGMIDLFVSVSDNDQYPSPKITNATIHLVIYSNTITLQQILSRTNHKITIEIVIISTILILISIISCLVLFIAHRQHKQTVLNKSTHSKILKEQIGFTEVILLSYRIRFNSISSRIILYSTMVLSINRSQRVIVIQAHPTMIHVMVHQKWMFIILIK
jgi:hypothetical protein